MPEEGPYLCKRPCESDSRLPDLQWLSCQPCEGCDLGDPKSLSRRAVTCQAVLKVRREDLKTAPEVITNKEL